MQIEQSLGFKFAKASQRLYTLFEGYLAAAGVTSKQHGTMLILSGQENLTQKEVAAIQRIDQTTMGQITDQLEAKKLLRRIRHPRDRRAYCLELTDEGRQLTATLWADMKRCEAEFLKVLDHTEINQLFTLLDKLEKEN